MSNSKRKVTLRKKANETPVPAGRKIIEDIGRSELIWHPDYIDLWRSDWQRSASAVVSGEYIYRVTREDFGLVGAWLLGYLLAHQHYIPGEFKSLKVFFWGTVYANNDGVLEVPYLYFRGDEDRFDSSLKPVASDFGPSEQALLVYEYKIDRPVRKID